MKQSDSFEIVDVAGEYLLIPLSNTSKVVNGVIAITEAVAYLLKNMQEDRSEQDLIDLLMREYEIDSQIAQADVHTMVKKLMSFGVITE